MGKPCCPPSGWLALSGASSAGPHETDYTKISSAAYGHKQKVSPMPNILRDFNLFYYVQSHMLPASPAAIWKLLFSLKWMQTVDNASATS